MIDLDVATLYVNIDEIDENTTITQIIIIIKAITQPHHQQRLFSAVLPATQVKSNKPRIIEGILNNITLPININLSPKLSSFSLKTIDNIIAIIAIKIAIPAY